MDWMIVIGVALLLLLPLGFAISAIFRMTIKKRALLFGILAACSVSGIKLLLYVTGGLPVRPLNLIFIGGFSFIVILLATGGIYRGMQRGREQWLHRYSQLDMPDGVTELFKRMYDIEDDTN